MNRERRTELKWVEDYKKIKDVTFVKKLGLLCTKRRVVLRTHIFDNNIPWVVPPIVGIILFFSRALEEVAGHPGGEGRFEAHRGVLDDHTVLRLPAEPSGRLEEEIGIRFSPLHILRGDDGVHLDPEPL